MLDLQFGVEPDERSSRCESISQFDVGYPRKLLVEAAQREKQLAPGKSAGAPKRRCTGSRVLMEIMMCQLLEQADRGSYQRIFIIGSDHSVYPRFPHIRDGSSEYAVTE